MPTYKKEPLKVVQLAGVPFFILPTYEGRLLTYQKFAA